MDHLRDWEEYLATVDIDSLVQCAAVHAQFELIHPFNDGNGRIGRLLIPLFLFQKKVLASPMFYLSEYLESNREMYYERLKAISQNGDWTGWVEFFLDAVIGQARSNSERVRGILDLYDEMKHEITSLTHSQHAMVIVRNLRRGIIKLSGALWAWIALSCFIRINQLEQSGVWAFGLGIG